jgi:flagellar secretion chaperone FliS
MMNNPYQTYNNTSVMTSSPGELTLMLYNGAIKFLKLAKAAIEGGNIQVTHQNMRRGQDILHELMATLNPDYEIAKNLMDLYEFMNRHLLQAQLKKSPEMVQEVIALLEDLRNTWSEAVKLAKMQNPIGANPA